MYEQTISVALLAFRARARVRRMNGTHKSQGRNKMNSMITRASLILAAFALAFLMPATCHAQAEVNPDCYAIDNATSSAPAPVAAASQPAAVYSEQARWTAPTTLASIEFSAPINRSAGLDTLRRVRNGAVAYFQRLANMMANLGQNNIYALSAASSERNAIS